MTERKIRQIIPGTGWTATFKDGTPPAPVACFALVEEGGHLYVTPMIYADSVQLKFVEDVDEFADLLREDQSYFEAKAL